MEHGLRELNGRTQMEIWSKRVADCRASSMSVAQWCKQEGINQASYYRWQWKLSQKLQETEVVQFAQVPTQYFSSNAVATLRIGDACVELRNGADADLIRNLVEALKSC